jgi:hypothetical protein
MQPADLHLGAGDVPGPRDGALSLLIAALRLRKIQRTNPRLAKCFGRL